MFDGGATETGRPYFVMELVRGIKITDYCDQANLSTKERLDLFIKVCHAIQHAHQKGIIHRDLKPSNVLFDGDVPKLVDFGVARDTTASVAMTVSPAPASRCSATIASTSTGSSIRPGASNRLRRG